MRLGGSLKGRVRGCQFLGWPYKLGDEWEKRVREPERRGRERGGKRGEEGWCGQKKSQVI